MSKKFLGTDVTVAFKGAANATLVIAGNTSCSLDLGANMMDATTKDDDDEWEAQIPASKNWSVSWDGLIVDTSADVVIETLVNSVLVGVTFKIGDSTYSGNGYITSSNFSGAVKDLAKANFSITGAGALTKVVVSNETNGQRAE